MKKLLILLMAALVIAACKKDDDEDDNTPTEPTFEEKIVGQYAFISGAFMMEVTMYNLINPPDTVTFPEGSDASLIVSASLLDDSPCDNPDNTLLDMREDYSLFYICQGEDNEDQMGTWDADEANNSLALNVNTELGPIAVTITDVVFNDDMLTGVIIGLPVPVDFAQPVSATNVQFITVSVEFMIMD